jgi:RHS repeat-associated protein
LPINTKDTATPSALTQTTLTYQADGDLASETLSWQNIPSNSDMLLNNIKQTNEKVLMDNDLEIHNLCQTELLSLPINLISNKTHLLCTNHSQYRQTTSGDNSTAAPVTTLSYSDTRNGELLARVSPTGEITLYNYDQLGRKTLIKTLAKDAKTLLDETKISYTNSDDQGNHSGYNLVTVSHLLNETNTRGIESANFFKRRILFDALGRPVAKQVNTCIDGLTTHASNINLTHTHCIPGQLIANHEFRTITTYSYTDSTGVAQQKVQTITDALGAMTHYQYDALGRQIAKITTEQEALGSKAITLIQGTFYDPLDHLQVSYPQVSIAVKANDSHVVNIHYFNADHKLIETRIIPLYQLQQAVNVPASQLFLPANQSILEKLLTDPEQHLGWIKTVQYNGLLQKQQALDAFGHSQYQYNNRQLLANVVSSANPLNDNNLENPTSKYQQIATDYNLLGQLIQTQASYSHNGQVAATHLGPIHRYNSLGQLVELKFPGTSGPALETQFSYDNDGHLTRRVDAYAHITYCRMYNGLGQPIESWDQTWPGLSTSPGCGDPAFTRQDDKVWHYYALNNQANQLAYIAFANNGQANMASAIQYHYYPDGALKTISYPGGLSISYQYNAMGQTTQVTYGRADSVQNQSYYQYGSGTTHQLLQVTNGDVKALYQYNDQGNLISTIRTTSNTTVTTKQTYNHYDLPAINTISQDHKEQQQLIDLYQAGQLSQTISLHPQIPTTNPQYSNFNRTRKYDYDGLNRLIAVQIGPWLNKKWLKTVNYTFDPNNNITHIEFKQNGVIKSAVNRRYDSADQLTKQSDTDGTWVANYSATANLTNPPSGGTYSYNRLNQLISVTKDGQTTNYRYYANGALAYESQGNQQLTFYYGSQGQLVRVQDNQGDWTSYTGGLTREGVTCHHRDGTSQTILYAYQGKTPSGWLTSLASTTHWQQRDPYGLSKAIYRTANNQPASSLNLADNPRLIGFNGSYQDPVTQDVFMGARVYNPILQRFLQLDSADTANRYAYAQDNPIVKWDPSGHMATWLKVALISIGMAVALVLTTIGGEEEMDAVLAEEETSLIEGVVNTNGGTEIEMQNLNDVTNNYPPVNETLSESSGDYATADELSTVSTASTEKNLDSLEEYYSTEEDLPKDSKTLEQKDNPLEKFIARVQQNQTKDDNGITDRFINDVQEEYSNGSDTISKTSLKTTLKRAAGIFYDNEEQYAEVREADKILIKGIVGKTWNNITQLINESAFPDGDSSLSFDL